MKKKAATTKFLIPIILALGFVPILVHEYTYSTHLSAFNWYPNSAERQVDFFLAYKSFAIIALGLIMLLILVFSYIKRKTLSFEPAFYLLFAYAGLVLISGLMSPYRAYAFRGGFEIFEPVWVVLSYVLFCYYTYHYVQTEAQVSKVLHWAGIGIMIVSLIGFFQYYKLDFFKSTFGKMLITDPSRWNKLDGLQFIFGDGVVYTTLYNVDFLSFYYGLLIPIILVLAISASKAWQRIIYSLIAVIFFICLKGSGAASGVLALVITTVFCVYLLLSRKKRAFLVGLGVGILGIIAGILVFCRTSYGPAITEKILGVERYEDSYVIQDIQTNDDNVTLVADGKTLVLVYQADTATNSVQFALTDGNGAPISYSEQGAEENRYFTLDDSAYENWTITPAYLDETTIGIKVRAAERILSFAKLSDGTYYYYNDVGKYDKVTKIPVSHLFYDDFLGRGWLWNRTLPLLKKYLFLGIGSNNYMLVYPQNDYIYKVNLIGLTTYDVKAHCWLLQQWVENGLLATLCLLSFYLWYFIQSVHLYRKANLKEQTALLGFGIFLGTIVYMVVSLANDSNVNTAPVFWVTLGLGFSVNRIVAKNIPAPETEQKQH